MCVIKGIKLKTLGFVGYFITTALMMCLVQLWAVSCVKAVSCLVISLKTTVKLFYICTHLEKLKVKSGVQGAPKNVLY